jgi:hypothetical protein
LVVNHEIKKLQARKRAPKTTKSKKSAHDVDEDCDDEAATEDIDSTSKDLSTGYSSAPWAFESELKRIAKVASEQEVGVDRETAQGNISQAGESSKLDSGYGSLESAGNGSKDRSDTETLYSIDTVIPELERSYIDDFSNHLAGDLHGLADIFDTSEAYQSFFQEFFKTFAQKLHAESTTRLQREASVFLHKDKK